MSIKVDVYQGNGTRKSVDVGFDMRDGLLFIMPATSEYITVKMPDLWCARSNVLASLDSFINGVKLTDTGFVVGSSSRVNTNAVNYHYVALARSAALKMGFAGVQGNGAAGRVVKIDDASLTPSAVMAKRDSTRSGVLQVLTSVSSLLSSSPATSAAGAISALAQGQFTISGSVYTNEYDPGLELGEGIDFWAFEDGVNFKALEFTGSGADRSVDFGFQPAMVIISRNSGTAAGARIKTSTMSTDIAKVVTNASGIVSTGITITPTGVNLTAASGLNTLNETYVAFAVRDHTEAPISAPHVLRRGKRAILLPGRDSGSHIDCGTDNSLVIDGSMTLEWMGSVEPLGRATPAPLLWRGAATTNTALSCSLALYLNGFVGSPGNWSGPQVSIGCADRLDLSTASTGIRTSWRTGLLLEYGDMAHLMATHDGVGGWNFYKNGRITRQRAIDLTSIPLPNIDGQAGHRMMIGGMYNSGAPVNNLQRQRFAVGRLYNRALTAAEVATRFARAGLRSSETDVTSGLLEEWDARNAFGSTLPATVNAGNNGTITNGSIITL